MLSAANVKRLHMKKELLEINLELAAFFIVQLLRLHT